MKETCIPEPEQAVKTEVEVNSGEMQIPEHAIRRFARFLLPKLQADLEAQTKSDESTLG